MRYLQLFLFFSSLVFSQTGIAQNPKDSLLAAGLEKFKNGNTIGCISDYKKIMAYDSTDAHLYYLFGIAYSIIKDDNHAIEYYTKSIALNQNVSEVFCQRAQTYYDLDKKDLAKIDFIQAIELDRMNADAYYGLGLISRNEGKFEDAINEFSKAIEIDSKESAYFFERAESRLGLELYYPAELDYSIAIELGYKLPDAYNNRGIAKVKQEKYTAALQDFNTALELDSNYVIGYLNRGRLNGIKGDTLQAINDLTRCIKLDPKNANAYYERGFIIKEKGRFKDAILDYNQAIQLDPSSYNALYERATCFARLGNFQQTIDDATRAIKIKNDIGIYYVLRGAAYYELNDRSKGCADLKKGVELNEPKALKFYTIYCN